MIKNIHILIYWIIYFILFYRFMILYICYSLFMYTQRKHIILQHMRHTEGLFIDRARLNRVKVHFVRPISLAERTQHIRRSTSLLSSFTMLYFFCFQLTFLLFVVSVRSPTEVHVKTVSIMTFSVPRPLPQKLMIVSPALIHDQRILHKDLLDKREIFNYIYN